METMTSKQFCERMYSMFKLMGEGCAHLSYNRFSCGYAKDNTALTNALIFACNKHGVSFSLGYTGLNYVNFVVDFNK